MAFVKDLQRQYAALPNANMLSDDDILGYDEFGAHSMPRTPSLLRGAPPFRLRRHE
jgi:hypothetical protein